MANVKITQLPSATTPLTGTEVFPLVQGTTTKQVAITGLFTSPVMTNPTLGTVGQADLINATGLPISTGVAGLGTGVATFLGTPSSTNLRAAVTDETGTGSLVFATSPTLVTPNLGTPSVLVATNATGTAVGLTAGSAITNANLTGAVTSVGNATSLGSFTSAQLRTALTDETGAGSAVFATSPTITAPILNQINDTNNAQILGLSPTTSAVDYLVVKNGTGVGVPLHFYADGSSANIGLHIQPKGTGLVTISDGTDFNKGIRFRSSSSAASAVTLLDAVSTAGRVVTLPDATTTLVGRDTTDTLTNKTIAFGSNTFSGTLAIANGGTGQATANAALNALLPAQTGNATKYLQTDGTDSSWDAISLSTADITGTLGTANGGTNLGGATPFTSGGVVYASSSSALATGSALTFDGTNLGIGIASATSLLDVRDGVGSIFTLGNTGNFAAGEFSRIKWKEGSTQLADIGWEADTNELRINNRVAYTTFYASNAEALRLTSTSLYTASGINVGIGTSSTSSARLTVAGVSNTGYTSFLANGTGTAYNLWRMTNTGGDLRIGIESATAVGILTGTTNYSSSIGTLTATDLQFGTNSTVRATIDSAGNLGLGVAPSAWDTLTALQVKNASLAAFGNSTYLYSNAYYQTAIGNRYIADGFATRYTQGSGKHIWETAPSSTANATAAFTEAMTLDASGNLLVNTTSDVTTTIGSRLMSGVTDPYISSTLTSSSNATTSYLLYSTGAAAYRFYVGMGGTISATNTTITAISDQRLKENIRDLDDGLDIVMALKPRKFDWKEGKGANIKNARGFIAQEFETVLPDMIETWKDPAPEGEEPYKAVNANLIPTLVKAMQEQQAIIESMRTEIDALKVRVGA